MVCPICGCETFRVLEKPSRKDDYDLRKIQCVDCKNLFIQESSLTRIQHKGEWVELSKSLNKEIQEEYIKFKAQKVREIQDRKLFNE